MTARIARWRGVRPVSSAGPSGSSVIRATTVHPLIPGRLRPPAPAAVSDPGATVRVATVAMLPHNFKHMFECRAGRVAVAVLQIVQAFDRTPFDSVKDPIGHSKIRHSKKGTIMAIAAPFPAARVTRGGRERHVLLSRPRHRRIGVASRRLGRLTRRGRLALVVSSTLFLLAIVMPRAADAPTPAPRISSRVERRASSSCSRARACGRSPRRSHRQADPRETVTAIRELNGLGDSTVVPGQSIVVPVARAS